MKPVTWSAVAVAILAGGYVWYTGQKTPEAAQVTPAAVETETESVVESAVSSTTDAVETATEAASEAVKTVTDGVTDAANVASDAVTDAATAASDAATVATEAASDATTVVTDTAAGVVDTATDTASDAATATTDAVTDAVAPAADAATGMSDFLTVDGFNYDKAMTAIDGSDLDVLKKTALKQGLEQAKANPDLLKSVLGQVKSALGL